MPEAFPVVAASSPRHLSSPHVAQARLLGLRLFTFSVIPTGATRHFPAPVLWAPGGVVEGTVATLQPNLDPLDQTDQQTLRTSKGAPLRGSERRTTEGDEMQIPSAVIAFQFARHKDQEAPLFPNQPRKGWGTLRSQLSGAPPALRFISFGVTTTSGPQLPPCPASRTNFLSNIVP
jgi:hypothetical protein